jgi:aminoglycoside phosphotransferase (APT) family kinase protein
VLKVPHDDPAPIGSVHIEAVAAPAAHAVNVRTPRVIVFDDSLDLLPVPYLVYERVHGEPLEALGRPPVLARQVWREVGRDLALAHTRVRASDSLPLLPTYEQSSDIDPRPWVEDVQDAGGLTAIEARWLGEVFDRLTSTVLAPLSKCFCHGDVNAANVMVGHHEPRVYVALLDWGGAGWADPASDFSGMSLYAVPFVLAGYREIAPLVDDDTAEARILWFYLRLALFGLTRKWMAESEYTQRIERLLRDTRWFFRWARLA